MNSLVRLTFFAISCQAGIANAFWGDGWLGYYECQDASQAISCEGCSLQKGDKVKFTVSAARANVIIQFQVNGVTSPPTALKDCTVLDQKNWSCNKKDKIGPINIEIQEGMANGVYSRRFGGRDDRGENRVQSFFCAK